MIRFSFIFLQIVIALIGIGVMAFLLWEPTVEGRNQNASFYEIYLKDPFLLYIYLGSSTFFIGLYQVYKLLGYVARNTVFSLKSLKSLEYIRHCALALIIFVIGAILYFFVVQAKNGEDIAGGVMFGFLIIIISVIVATTATLMERTIKKAIDIQAENDLTI